MSHFTPEEITKAVWPDGAPKRAIACRHCDQKNRVSVALAVLNPDRCRCGRCGGQLFLAEDEPYVELQSEDYQHDLDKKSLAALRGLPGFSTAMKWLLKHLGERQMRLLFLASNVRCGPEQFPELVALLGQASDRLKMARRPEIFLGESPLMNAATTGVEDPMILVNAALLDFLSDDEVRAVLGHELGHIQSNHQLYHIMAMTFLRMGAGVMAGIAKLATMPLTWGLLKWYRCSELTADRAALLATRDLGTNLQLFLKMAGGARPGTSTRTRIKLAPFIAQARALAAMEHQNALDGAMSLLNSAQRRHPFVAWRVMHLLQWIEDGNYLNLMAGRR